jgi:hypothetical protein
MGATVPWKVFCQHREDSFQDPEILFSKTQRKEVPKQYLQRQSFIRGDLENLPDRSKHASHKFRANA